MPRSIPCAPGGRRGASPLLLSVGAVPAALPGAEQTWSPASGGDLGGGEGLPESTRQQELTRTSDSVPQQSGPKEPLCRGVTVSLLNMNFQNPLKPLFRESLKRE